MDIIAGAWCFQNAIAPRPAHNWRVIDIQASIAARDMAEARRVPMSVNDSCGGDIIAAACVHMGSTVAADLFRGTWLAAPYIAQH